MARTRGSKGLGKASSGQQTSSEPANTGKVDITATDTAPKSAQEPSDKSSDEDYLKEDLEGNIAFDKLKGWDDVIRVLPGISSVSGLKEWLCRDIFRDPWIIFYEQFLLPKQDNHQIRGADRETVLQTIDNAKSIKDRKYSKSQPSSEGWSHLDWYCWLFQNIWNANEEDANGLFFNSGLNVDQRQKILWFLIVKVRGEFALSRYSRGWRMLKLDKAIRQRLREKFPILTQKKAKAGPESGGESADNNSEGPPQKRLKSGREGSKLARQDETERSRDNKDVTEAKSALVPIPDAAHFGPSTVGRDLWRKELNQVQIPIPLHKISEKPNFDEDFWKYRLVTACLEMAERLGNESDVQAATEQDGFQFKQYSMEEISNILQETTVNRDDNLEDIHGSLITKFDESVKADTDADTDIPSDKLLHTTEPSTPTKKPHPEPQPTPQKELLATAVNQSLFRSNEGLELESQKWVLELERQRDTSTLPQEAEDGSLEAEWVKSGVDLEEIICPTNDALLVNMQHATWRDVLAYQRENIAEANARLHISDPNKPTIQGMRPAASFYEWQPLAITALLKMNEDPLLSGGILADDMGLGKTWSALGFTLVSTQESLLLKNLKPKPIIVVVPPGLVWQWHSEIHKGTDYFQVVVYYGDARDKKAQGNVISSLCRNDDYFKGSQDNARTLIITSYNTLCARHGPSAQAEWQTKNHRTLTGNKLDEDWPGNLSGCFRLMILDEAHTLRNTDTQTSQTLRWFRAPFNLLLTATPIFNTIKDFLGIAPFILNPNKAMPPVPEGFHPLALDKSTEAIIFTLPGLRKYVFGDKGMSGIQKGVALRPIWDRCVIRRTLISRIPFRTGRQIGDTIPIAVTRQLDVKFTKFEQAIYDKQAEPLLAKLYVRKQSGAEAPSADAETSDRRLLIRGDKLRLLILLQSWLPLALIQHNLMAKDNAKLDQALRENKLARFLVRKTLQMNWKVQHNLWLIEKTSWRPSYDGEAFPKEAPQMPPPADKLHDHLVLVYLLLGSPKMRKLLAVIRDQVWRVQEKSIVWCANPAQQFYVAAVLRLAGIDAHALHAALSPKERATLMHRFTTEPSEVTVLVNSYYVNSAGANLQGLCRNVHLFDIPSSYSILEQAIGRVRRLGQDKIVKVYDYRLDGSFNMQQISRHYEKSIPALSLFLSSEEWEVKVTDDHEIDIGFWIENKDGSVSKLSQDIVNNMPSSTSLLSTEAMFARIVEAYQSNQLLNIRPQSDKSDYEKALATQSLS